MRWSRRRFLAGAGAVAAAAAVGACDTDGNTERTPPPPRRTTTSPPAPASTLAPVDHGPPRGSPPFALGVASGDPDDTSVVLWTWVDRPAALALTVELAFDEAFTAVVARTTTTAEPDASMTARVVVDGLVPDTVHWYRFVGDGHISTPARTRTAPAPGEVPDAPIRVGQVSCQRWSSGYWTALEDLAAQLPDLVLHCGDYVYEDEIGSVRPIDVPVPTDLDGYRALWRRYKQEPALQAAHAVAPWLIVWDDHEVTDNYQGTTAGGPTGGDEFLAQRAAAYRAWWEFTPTRLPPPDGPTLQIHRTADWGGLARFVLLDTRQHRDDQPCEGTIGRDVGPRCPASDAVTMLGDEQQAWFEEVATAHDAVWTAVVQQVVVHQWRLAPGDVAWNLDQWDGYPGARRRFLDTLSRAPTPVVLTGDVHSSWVAELHADPGDDDSPVVATELVAPGVSSEIPAQLRVAAPLIELLSTGVAWSEVTRRGWVLHEIAADGWTATYRLVEDATVPDAPVAEASSWALSPGRAGLA